MDKYVYSFGRGRAEGSSLMRNLLGGKGCELAEMTNLGILVPPGLTITTQAWAQYSRGDRRWPDGLWDQVIEALTKLEGDSGLTFGDLLRSPVRWTDITKNLVLQVGYVAVFATAAWARFTTKDVLA